MTDHEFHELISAVIGDVRYDLQVMRLAGVVRMLIEMGGAPAADALRALAQLRGQDLSGNPHVGGPWAPQGGAER